MPNSGFNCRTSRRLLDERGAAAVVGACALSRIRVCIVRVQRVASVSSHSKLFPLSLSAAPDFLFFLELSVGNGFLVISESRSSDSSRQQSGAWMCAVAAHCEKKRSIDYSSEDP